ncbi:MAG: RNA polymerase sigma-70 factor [Bacteroides sp.]|nr:RNA polymerase sigma-70 factor [Bacteroides sp.]
MEQLDEQQKRRKFEQFFILTFPKVKAFAWKVLGSKDDAEDVAQDVFVKLWDCPEIWENQDTWNGYIYTMVRNAIYDFLKHKSIEENYQEQLAAKERPLTEPDFQSQLYADEIALLVELALDNMPEQRRKIFVMSRKQGLSNQEIADTLDLSVRTVEHHIYLALQQLKKIILIAFFSYFA